MSEVENQNQMNFKALERKFSLPVAWREYTADTNQRLIAWGYSILLIVILIYAVTSLLDGSSTIFNLLALIGGVAFGYHGLLSWFNTTKMRAFAQGNNLQFLKNSSRTNFDGMIFGIGHSRQTTGYMMPADSIIDAVANYNYTVGSGRNRRTYRYGFVRLELPRRLPHMVLDSRKNNFFGLTNLARSFKSAQKLRLEGDFNDFFTLYAPLEYERDALYVFTPDIMQIMVDSFADYDVEIINNSIYVYRSQPLKLAEKAEVENILTVARRLAEKLSRRVDYYADERVDDRDLNIVASEGSRLKSGIPLMTIIIIGIFVAFYSLPILLDLLAR